MVSETLRSWLTACDTPSWPLLQCTPNRAEPPGIALGELLPRLEKSLRPGPDLTCSGHSSQRPGGPLHTTRPGLSATCPPTDLQPTDLQPTDLQSFDSLRVY